MTAAPDGSQEPAPPWSHLLVETGHMDELLEPIRSSARIQYTCVSVSRRYLALGSNTGYIYIFSRDTHKYLNLLPGDKDGAIIKVVFGPDEHTLAYANSNGFVQVVRLRIDQRSKPDKLRSTLDHRNSLVTAIKWHHQGNELYVGDDQGRVSVVHINIKARDLLKPTSEVIMRLESVIIQIDTFEDRVLVSTLQRSFLGFTSRHQFKQIGTRARDGYYGACFYHTVVMQMPVIYCGRPGSRMWEVDSDGEVLNTQEFKQLLAIPSLPVLQLKDKDAVFPGISDDAVRPQSINYQQLCFISNQFLLTWNSKGLYLFDPAKIEVIMWTNQIRGEMELAISGNEIFILQKHALHKLELFSIPKLVAKIFNLKQWLLAASLCQCFQASIISVKSRRHVPITMIKQLIEIIQLPSMEQADLLQGLLEMFEKLEVPSESRPRSSSSQSSTATVENDLRNRSLSGLSNSSGSSTEQAGPALHDISEEELSVHPAVPTDETPTACHAPGNSGKFPQEGESDSSKRKLDVDIPSSSEAEKSEQEACTDTHPTDDESKEDAEEDSSESEKLPVNAASEDPEKEAILSEVYPPDILAHEINEVTTKEKKSAARGDPRLSIDKLQPLLDDSDGGRETTQAVENLPSKTGLSQKNTLPCSNSSGNASNVSGCHGKSAPFQAASEPQTIEDQKCHQNCESGVGKESSGCPPCDLTSQAEHGNKSGCVNQPQPDSISADTQGGSRNLDADCDELVIGNSVDSSPREQYCHDSFNDCSGDMVDGLSVDGVWIYDNSLDAGSSVFKRHSSGETDSGILVRHSSMESITSGQSSSATASVSSSELMTSNVSIEPEPIFAKSKEKPVKSKGKKMKAMTVDLDASDPIAIPAVARVRRSQTVTAVTKKKKRTRRTMSESVPSNVSVDDSSLHGDVILSVPILPLAQKSLSLTKLTETSISNTTDIATSMNHSQSEEFLPAIEKQASPQEQAPVLPSSQPNNNNTKMDFKLKDSVISALSSFQSKIGVKSNSKESIQQLPEIIEPVCTNEDDTDAAETEEMLINSARILQRMSHNDTGQIDEMKVKGQTIGRDVKENGGGSLESSLEVDRKDLLSSSPSTKLKLLNVKEKISTTTKSLIQTIKDKGLSWKDENPFHRDSHQDPELLDVATSEAVVPKDVTPVISLDIDTFLTATFSIRGQLQQPEILYDPPKVRVLLHTWCHELHKLFNEFLSKSYAETTTTSRDSIPSFRGTGDTDLKVESHVDNAHIKDTAGSVNVCNDEHITDSSSTQDIPNVQTETPECDIDRTKAKTVCSSDSSPQRVPNDITIPATDSGYPCGDCSKDESRSSDLLLTSASSGSVPSESNHLNRRDQMYSTVDDIIYVKDPFHLPETIYEAASELACKCFEFRCHGHPSRNVSIPTYPAALSEGNIPDTATNTHHGNDEIASDFNQISGQGVHMLSDSASSPLSTSALSVLSGNLAAEDDYEMDYELSLFLRIHFHFFIGSLDRIHKAITLSKGKRFRRWNSLLTAIGDACEGDLVHQMIERQEVDSAFDLLQVKLAQDKGTLCLGYLHRLYQLVPLKTLEFCANDMKDYISPLEVLYLCRHSDDVSDRYRYMYYINSYLPHLRNARRDAVMVELSGDCEVRHAWLSALFHHGLTADDQSQVSQLACLCGYPSPGAHRVAWKQQTILDEILNIPACQGEDEKELCLRNHYWRGYLHLMAVSGERDLWQTYALQLGDIDLLSDTKGCGPCSASEWEVMLCKKEWQHHGNLLKKSLMENDATELQQSCPIYCLSCGSDLTVHKEQANGDANADWLPTVTWENLVTRLVMDVGQQKGLELLKRVHIPHGALPSSFFQKCVTASVLEHQQKLYIKSALEKLDTYLWSKRSSALPPQLSYAVHMEKMANSSPEECSADTKKLFLGLQDAPPLSLDTLEDQEVHWGISADVLRWCRCCGLSLTDTVCHQKPGCIFFKCGHGYHRACVQETICVACLSTSGSSVVPSV